MLVSRDEQSCLVVSYREVKACVESAFRSVLFPALPPPFPSYILWLLCDVDELAVL